MPGEVAAGGAGWPVRRALIQPTATWSPQIGPAMGSGRMMTQVKPLVPARIWLKWPLESIQPMVAFWLMDAGPPSDAACTTWACDMPAGCDIWARATDVRTVREVRT